MIKCSRCGMKIIDDNVRMCPRPGCGNYLYSTDKIKAEAETNIEAEEESEELMYEDIDSKCPECGNKHLQAQEGCEICTVCGWTACNN